MSRFEAVVFDKDGTLVDFERTWNPAIGHAIETVAGGNTTVARTVADAIGYDLTARVALPDAALIAASNAEIVALIPDGLGGERLPELFATMVLETITAVTHAELVLDHLERSGIPVAIATNDDENSTRAQLERLGWSSRFGAVLGYDSGHGPKPEPGMVIEACRRLGVAPARAMMVGDSSADIESGRAAGATTVYVGPDAAHGASAHHWIAELDELVEIIG